MTLEELYQIIEKRKQEKPENSYSSSLFNQGEDRIIQKVGEEATEVLIAAKNGNKKEIISEVADLWFHSVVLLAVFDLSPKDILDELESRKK